RFRTVTTGAPSVSSDVTMTLEPVGGGLIMLPGLKPKLTPARVCPLVMDTVRATPAAGTVGAKLGFGTTRMLNGPLAGSFGFPLMTSGPTPVKMYPPLAALTTDGSPVSNTLLL